MYRNKSHIMSYNCSCTSYGVYLHLKSRYNIFEENTIIKYIIAYLFKDIT